MRGGTPSDTPSEICGEYFRSRFASARERPGEHGPSGEVRKSV